ncbi:hypothetical protein BLOT_010175, partial [Blomia tropicalis]
SKDLNAVETNESDIFPPYCEKIKVDLELRYPKDLFELNFDESKNELKQYLKNDYNSKEKEKYELNEEGFPSGWELLTIASNPSLSNGYFGAAFWHPEREQVIIAHRSTKPTNVGSLWTDFKSVLKNDVSSQINSAVTFTHHVQQVFADIDSEGKTHFQMFITGHSLGAWLAQVCTFSMKYLTIVDKQKYFGKSMKEGYHAHTVVFDSPGCKTTLRDRRRRLARFARVISFAKRSLRDRGRHRAVMQFLSFSIFVYFNQSQTLDLLKLYFLQITPASAGRRAQTLRVRLSPLVKPSCKISISELADLLRKYRRTMENNINSKIIEDKIKFDFNLKLEYSPKLEEVNDQESLKKYLKKVLMNRTKKEPMKRNIDEECGTYFQMFITGYSFGGWLAQICTFSAKYLTIKKNETKFSMLDQDQEGHQVHTVVFDSPGCRPILEKIQKSYISNKNNNRKILTIDTLDINCYLSAPNQINTFNAHVGKVFQVVNQSTLLRISFINFICLNYNLKFIASAFDKKTKQFKKDKCGKFQIEEVKDWPKTKDSFWFQLLKNLKNNKFEKSMPFKSSFQKGSTLLHHSINNGSVEVVEKLLECLNDNKYVQKEFIKCTDDYGCNSLHVAAFNGHIDIIEKLLEYFDDNKENQQNFIKIKDNKGYTPFHFAVQNGHDKIIKKLLSYFNDVNAQRELINDKDNVDYTPFKIAAKKGHAHVVEVLLEYFDDKIKQIKNTDDDKSKDRFSALHLACQNGHVETIEKLLHYFDDNKRDQLNFLQDKSMKGITGLHLAVQDGHLEAVKKLLTYFVDDKKALLKFIEDTTLSEYNSLHIAAFNGHEIIIEELLGYFDHKEAQLNFIKKKNINGYNALHLASQKGHIETIHRLLTYFDNNEIQKEFLKSKNKNGCNSLQLAAIYGHVLVVEKLLEYFDDKLAQQEFIKVKVLTGHNALHQAADHGHVAVIEKLLSYFDNRDTQQEFIKEESNNGFNSFSFALINGHVEVIEKLLDYFDNDIQQKLILDYDKNGYNFLYYASQYGHVLLMEKLLEYFENIQTILETYGHKCLHLAAIKGNIEIIQKLFKCCDSKKTQKKLLNDENQNALIAFYFATQWNGEFDFEKLLKYFEIKET